MSIQLSDYRSQSFEALVEEAHQKGFDNAGQLSLAELIFEVLCADVQSAGTKVDIVADGLLEILSDGFGFLRSPVSGFAAGADDIYVSPAQIRRFNLRTGDWIQGLVRTPRDNERYFALLRIQQVNGRSPEDERLRLGFDAQSLAMKSRTVSDLPYKDVRVGSSILVGFDSKEHPSQLLFTMIEQADSVVLTLLNYPAEDLEVLKRAWPKGISEGRLLCATRGSDCTRRLQVLEFGLQRSKRLAEQHQDVHWVVLSANDIALSARDAAEQQGRQGAESLGFEKLSQTFGQAKDLETTGALTVWMGAHSGRSHYETSVIERLSFDAAFQGTVANGVVQLTP